MRLFSLHAKEMFRLISVLLRFHVQESDTLQGPNIQEPAFSFSNAALSNLYCICKANKPFLLQCLKNPFCF